MYFAILKILNFQLFITFWSIWQPPNLQSIKLIQKEAIGMFVHVYIAFLQFMWLFIFNILISDCYKEHDRQFFN